MKIVGFQQAHIRRQTIAGVDQDNIAGHQLHRRNLHNAARTAHQRLGHHHAENAAQRLLGLAFLEKTDQRIDQHHRPDHQRINVIADQQRHQAGHHQHIQQHIVELIEQPTPGWSRWRIGQTVFTKLCTTRRDVFWTQAVH